MAAGFGAEAARAEGSIWDKAIDIGTGWNSYIAAADGFIVIDTRNDGDDGQHPDFSIKTASGATVTLGELSGHYWDVDIVTIPISKGDTLEVNDKGGFRHCFFVGGGGAAVDDGVPGYFYFAQDSF